MNPGKVSNSILKRSVLKQIKKREEYAAKPAIGVDCAYISLQKKDKPAVVSAAAAATGDIAAKNPVQRAANNIYAGGGIPVAAECTVLLPLSAEEAKLPGNHGNAPKSVRTAGYPDFRRTYAGQCSGFRTGCNGDGNRAV